MKKKKLIYYRRKGKSIIAEGQTVHYGKKKTVYLFTVPPIEKMLKSSLFTLKKAGQIKEKIARLKKSSNNTPKGSHNQDYTNSPELINPDGQTKKTMEVQK